MWYIIGRNCFVFPFYLLFCIFLPSSSYFSFLFFDYYYIYTDDVNYKGFQYGYIQQLTPIPAIYAKDMLLHAISWCFYTVGIIFVTVLSVCFLHFFCLYHNIPIFFSSRAFLQILFISDYSKDYSTEKKIKAVLLTF